MIFFKKQKWSRLTGTNFVVTYSGFQPKKIECIKKGKAMKQIFTMIIMGFLLTAGCTTPGKKTAIGTGLGAAGGAGIGAAIGSASGNAGKGALIGAAAGAILGGVIGNRLDKQVKELAQYAETRRTDQGILVSLKGDILFDSGKANLKPDASTQVKEIATILAKYPEDRIVVVGHHKTFKISPRNHTELGGEGGKGIIGHFGPGR